MSRSPSPSRKDHSRRSGCTSCRVRRIKCDESHPVCERCREGGFDCLWIRAQHDQQRPGTTESAVPASPPKERGRLACLPCRERKIRCAGPSGETAGASCPRCERLSIPCHWAASRRSRRSGRPETTDTTESTDPGHVQTRTSEADSIEYHAPGDRRSLLRDSISNLDDETAATRRAGPSVSPLERLLADKVEVQLLIRTYFATVHYYGFLSFIHEPSFFRMLDKGSAPKELTTMMLACTLRFAGNCSVATLDRAEHIYNEAFRSVREHMYEGFGAVELMTTMLARMYAHSKGHFSSAWLLWGNAVRMMQFLSLHKFDEAYPPAPTRRMNPLLQREALRRLAWSVFYLDTLADAGRHGFHLITESSYRIQLPCDETNFLRSQEVVTAPLKSQGTSDTVSPAASLGTPHNEGPTNIGISGHLIRTAAMRRRILHYNSLIRYSDEPSSKMLDDLVAFEKDLRQVIADLPPDLAYTEQNLFVHAPRRGAFILLHLWRHNCFLMLAWTRLNVCARGPALEDAAKTFLRDRIRHAIPVSRIVGDILRLGVNCDPAAGVQAYTSLEALLFDPLRLSQNDPSVNPKDPVYADALRVLLEYLRKQSITDYGNRLLRLEACRRLIRCGFADILSPADWEACQEISATQINTGKDDDEFDFRQFIWNRSQIDRPDLRAADALLDPSTRLTSRAVSRAASPQPPHLDAGDVVLGLTATLGDSLDQGVSSGSMSHFGSTLLGLDNAQVLGEHEMVPGALDMGDSNTVFTHPPFEHLESSDQRRWFDLDNSLDPGTLAHSAVGGLQVGIGTNSSADDFSRFLEVAGYAGPLEPDPLAWLIRD